MSNLSLAISRAIPRIQSIQGEIRYARERQKSRKSAKLYGIVHSSQLKRMEWTKKRGGDLRALTKLRPRWKRQVMPELKRYCKARVTSLKVDKRAII